MKLEDIIRNDVRRKEIQNDLMCGTKDSQQDISKESKASLIHITEFVAGSQKGAVRSLGMEGGFGCDVGIVYMGNC